MLSHLHFATLRVSELEIETRPSTQLGEPPCLLRARKQKFTCNNKQAARQEIPPAKSVRCFTHSVRTQEQNDVVKSEGTKQILNSLSGMFKSGELTAIMGPSGAGKSSLLNILSGFHKSGTSGMIRCTGQEVKSIDKVSYTKDSCYILQDDMLCPLFTVWETMVFAAKLKLGTTIPPESRHWLLSNILETLGLAETIHTRCNRLSGGQRKRLSIALELIDNPPIMFLDEPTTGLDSLSSFQCVSVLKDLAHDGRTIICTIHQPSASIFEMFDHVYVIADGQCLYQGTALNTIPFLASVGLDCPQYHNPADHLLEVANCEYGDFNDKLVKATRESNWRIKPKPHKLQLIQQPSRSHLLTNEERTMVLVQKPSEFYRFRVLLLRNLIQLYRDWTTFYLRLLVHFLLGILLGVFYFDIGTDAGTLINNIGFVGISVTYMAYTSMLPAVLKLPSEVLFVRKENFNNYYYLSTYYATYITITVPQQIIFAFTFTSITYTMTGQPLSLDRYIIYLYGGIMINIISDTVGQIIGTFLKASNGTFVAGVLTAYLLLLSGFFIVVRQSTVASILVYTSYHRYVLHTLIDATLGNNRENLPCVSDYCHYNVDSILEEYSLNSHPFYVDVIYLFTTYILASLFGYLALKVMTKKV
ncbi:ATP-binding cassette subfamily G member 4-like isoform X3 [Atheta coriaria]|uniref:ATP-binding cassette subfamily G member 4-like isoform X3 n=1 Tax=Dalotia coriaria TaxID=877792 RepID=UPI0031F36076